MARPEKPKTPLGQRLTLVRRALGYEARKGFADVLAIPTDTLGTYERGVSEPRVELMAVYRERFGVNLSWLITGQGEMFEDPSKAPIQANVLEADLMRKLGRIVVVAHRDAGIKILPEDVPGEAAELFNELQRRVEDMNDPEEIEAVFPQLRLLLKKQLAEATSQPGSGKQEAS